MYVYAIVRGDKAGPGMIVSAESVPQALAVAGASGIFLDGVMVALEMDSIVLPKIPTPKTKK